MRNPLNNFLQKDTWEWHIIGALTGFGTVQNGAVCCGHLENAPPLRNPFPYTLVTFAMRHNLCLMICDPFVFSLWRYHHEQTSRFHPHRTIIQCISQITRPFVDPSRRKLSTAVWVPNQPWKTQSSSNCQWWNAKTCHIICSRDPLFKHFSVSSCCASSALTQPWRPGNLFWFPGRWLSTQYPKSHLYWIRFSFTKLVHHELA